MLTPEQARRAIYIDFEGEGKRQDGHRPMPHLVGEVRPAVRGGGGNYSAVFFHDSWKPVHNGYRAISAMRDFSTWVAQLAKQASEEERHVAYWTVHEETMLQAYAERAVYDELRPWLFNLRPPTRRYLRRLRQISGEQQTDEENLEACFAVVYRKRHPFPPLNLGAAESCRRIDTACAAHGRWRQFTDRQKA